MCNFFSFVTVNGEPKFLDATWREKKGDGDSHSVICSAFGLDCDRVNKYEFTGGEFVIDQLNAEDDAARAERWVRAFSGTEEFAKIRLAAVKQDGRAIQFLSNPTEAERLAAVKQNGLAIQFLSNPTNAERMAAVKQNGYAIKYLSNPTNAERMAVKQNGSAIRYLSNPTNAERLATKNR